MSAYTCTVFVTKGQGGKHAFDCQPGDKAGKAGNLITVQAASPEAAAKDAVERIRALVEGGNPGIKIGPAPTKGTARKKGG